MNHKMDLYHLLGELSVMFKTLPVVLGDPGHTLVVQVGDNALAIRPRMAHEQLVGAREGYRITFYVPFDAPLPVRVVDVWMD